MTIQIAQRIGRALGVRSATRLKELDTALREYVRSVPTGATLPIGGSIDASQVASGTFADGRISQSSVTQHEAALNIDWLQLSSVPSLFAPADHLSVGTWTPVDASGAGLVLPLQEGYYEKHEKLVLARCLFSFPVTADGSNSLIGGLPFALMAGEGNCQGFITLSDLGAPVYVLPRPSTSTFRLYNGAAARLTNAGFSNKFAYCTLIYRTP